MSRFHRRSPALSLGAASLAATFLLTATAHAGFFEWANEQAKKLGHAASDAIHKVEQGVQKVVKKVEQDAKKVVQEVKADAKKAGQAIANVVHKAEDFFHRLERGLGKLEKVGEKVVRFIKTGVQTAAEVWEQLKTIKLTLQEKWTTRLRSVDLSKQMAAWHMAVKDQGQTTTCMAQATSTAFEYMTIGYLSRNPAIARAVVGRADVRGLQLSRRHIYWLSRHGLIVCNDKMKMWGSWGAQAASWLKRVGTFQESLWPFAEWNPNAPGKYASCLEASTNGNPPASALRQSHFMVRDWRYLPGVEINEGASSRNIGDLRGILARGYPVVISVFTFGGHLWSVDKKNPVVHVPTSILTKPDNAHYIALVGYDDARQAFRFVNSWGTSWGQGGFGWLPYEYVQRYIIEGLVIRQVGVR